LRGPPLLAPAACRYAGAGTLPRKVPVRKLLAVLLLLAGCGETLPLALQNQSDASMSVIYASKGGKCDPAKPETLAPSERLLAKCDAADLISVTVTTPDGRKCVLSQADVARLVQERKGMKGSFLLPLKAC
jgi:hypothetical protein